MDHPAATVPELDVRTQVPMERDLASSGRRKGPRCAEASAAEPSARERPLRRRTSPGPGA